MVEFVESPKQNWLAYLTHYGLVTRYSDIYLGGSGNGLLSGSPLLAWINFNHKFSNLKFSFEI